MHEERRKGMNTPLELTAPEAAVALAAMVSFADDNPSEPEGTVLRRYYRHATAEQLQRKLDAAGITYPGELSSIEDVVLRTLGESPPEFRLRTIAAGWLLAQADGEIDQSEVRLLARYAEALGVSLTDSRNLAAAGMAEVDEMHDELAVASDTSSPAVPPEQLPTLSAPQAGAALAAWVGFADDDPSEEEAAVVREFYDAEDFSALTATMEKAGLVWPDSLPELEQPILHSLAAFARNEQLRVLAIAYRVATADGEKDPGEIAIVRRFCEELGIGLVEVEEFFKSTPG
jgi:uncharacterized tellurite resistance protein B-like protein